MGTLKAFTLMEMMLVMLLSGLVISSALLVYRFAQGQFQDYDLNAQSNLEVVETFEEFKKHWHQAKSIKFTEDQTLEMTGDNFQLSYLLSKNPERIWQFPMQENQQLDMQFFKIESSFRGEKALPGMLVDQLIGEFQFQGSRLAFTLKKEYAIKDLAIHGN